MVIIHEESLPRRFWKLGLVEKLLKGQDGVARGALVKLAPKNGKSSFLRCPIQRLYPLEVHQEPEESPLATDEQDTAEPLDLMTLPLKLTLKVRAAAQKSEEMRRLWIKELSEDT